MSSGTDTKQNQDQTVVVLPVRCKAVSGIGAKCELSEGHKGCHIANDGKVEWITPKPSKTG